ncbi:hypothetical protein MAPG_11698 [Magnaporthiopsis poae ATCC 64411]|uniref:WKF domain-containing protein n=1 Tax=Magnaporthiopsis poae (strain ATCC 64411 / 73-15) TaxID=644358 RepID=A0A0C4EFY8_MAGP6|nr:hypothetical protein MAPG_11698 [Magnaporthiopsis poae ATCC 64411]
MAPQTSPARSVPAWKRLGLKLKGAGETLSTPSAKPVATSSGAASTSGSRDSPSWANKRKEYPSPASQFASSKRLRTDFDQAAQTPGRRKSVTFADGTKGSDLDPSATKTPSKPSGAAEDKQQKKKAKKPKARKPAKKPEQNYKPDHLQPQLSQYLRDWHTARDTWKFRKNIQTLVIKYAFDPVLLPAADFPIFRKYAVGLQGASRDWLRNSAAEIRKRDLEQKGASGFPAGTTDADVKQKRYEALVAKMLDAQGSKPRRGGGSSNANGKRVRDDYNEEDLVMGGTEVDERGFEVTQRLVKRLRAEMVLDELSDADASDVSAATTSTATTTTTTTNGASSEGEAAATTPSAEEAKAKAADSSQKRRRQRKKRTVDDDDSSSSDDSSDSSDNDDAGSADEEEDEEGEDEDSDNESTSSSGTSSSGSDSDSSDAVSEGTLRRLAQEREALDTSSSSSSSSSGSESESGSDGESEL